MLFRSVASAYPALRLVMVDEAPQGVAAALIDKPYRMDALRMAIAGAGTGS